MSYNLRTSRSNWYMISFIVLTTYSFIAYLTLNNLIAQSGIDIDTSFGNTTILVVAHPDDETMFFGPTIINLIKNNKYVLILSLTNGNAEQIGDQRKQELYKVVEAFGPSVTLSVVEDLKLPDDMVTEWQSIDIIEHIEKQIRGYSSPINTLVTFDSYGISGHVNHRSIYQALASLKNKLHDLEISYLTLKSVSIWRKYTFFLDSVFTAITNYIDNESRLHKITLGISLSEHASLRGILGLHSSQMVWFRQLYMMFSRYMFINELVTL